MEYWDIYDKDKKPTGRTMKRKYLSNKGQTSVNFCRECGPLQQEELYLEKTQEKAV